MSRLKRKCEVTGSAGCACVHGIESLGGFLLGGSVPNQAVGLPTSRLGAFWGFPVASDVRCGCRGGEAVRLFRILGPQKGRCELCGGRASCNVLVKRSGRLLAAVFWGPGGEGWPRRAPLPGVGLKRGGLPVGPTSNGGWCREGLGSERWEGRGRSRASK